MNILTKYTSRDYLRNGKLNIQGGNVTSTTSYGGGGGISISGNYLPATQNADGTYTVDLTQVTFNGNILSTGEITAYGVGSSSATTGTSTSGSVTIYDGLDSDSALIALSANQGRILKELIQSMGSGGTSINIVIDEDSLSNNQILVYNSTTKQWENKNNEGISEISKLKDVSLSNLSNNQILQYNSTTSKWENKNFNTEISALTEHINDTVKHITTDERNKWNSAVTSSHTHSNKTVLDKITDTKLTNWDGVVTNWNKAFYFDSNGNLRVKLNLIGDEEISAYGSGTSTSSGAITIVDSLNSTLTDAALSANQGRVLKDMIDSANLGDFDLSDYSKTSHTHSNYSVTSHTHSNYSTTSHTHSNYSTTSHTHTDYSKTGHTHSYTSTVKLGTTSYNVSDNTISLPAYPTLSTLGAASSTDLTNHTGNTTAHITATERTNWNKAYTNNHTHSNKSVIDGITSTKITNWDNVVSDWNDVFEIDSNGNLKVKVNLYGQGEISAYGSGATGGNTDINLGNYYTKEQIDGMFDSMGGTIDLSDYSKTSHTHSNYSTTSHTHSAYAETGHSHSNYATTTNFNSHSGNTTLHITAAERTAWNAKSDAHSHPYASSSHTHSISNITNLQSTLDGKSGTGHSHSNYSVTSHTHSNYSTTGHTHSVIVGSYTSNGGQQAPNYFGKNRVGALMMNTTVNGNSDYKDWLFMDCYSGNDVGGGVAFGVNRQNLGAYIMRSASGRTSWAASAELIGTHNYTKYCATSGHTHNYAGSSSAGGAATSANKVNSSLSWSGYNSGSFNGSSAASFTIPSNTNQLTNGAGFITSGATVAAANKLATSRTLWGQSFNGTANVTGNITGSYFKINDTSSNPYLQLTQGSTWYIQGYNNYLYLGAGSTKSLRVDATGNCLSVGEVTAHSDKRLKDNIQPLTNRGYITPTTYIKDGKESIGFIAQDMQKLYPELVTVDESTEEKYLTVNYMQYTAVLQAQIIELSKEIQELKDKLNDIYNKE